MTFNRRIKIIESESKSEIDYEVEENLRFNEKD